MKPIRTVSGTTWVLDRADVDTDQIIPKQFLKRIERTGFGEFLFYDWVRSGEIALERAPIMVAGANFGCGSSREHAVWAIQDYGFDAVIAPSFSDIFFSNCTKCGVLPIVLSADEVRAVMQADHVEIDLAAQTVRAGGKDYSFDIDPAIKHRLLNGLDEIALTLENAADIERYENERAYPAPVTTAL